MTVETPASTTTTPPATAPAAVTKATVATRARAVAAKLPFWPTLLTALLAAAAVVLVLATTVGWIWTGIIVGGLIVVAAFAYWAVGRLVASRRRRTGGRKRSRDSGIRSLLPSWLGGTGGRSRRGDSGSNASGSAVGGKRPAGAGGPLARLMPTAGGRAARAAHRNAGGGGSGGGRGGGSGGGGRGNRGPSGGGTSHSTAPHGLSRDLAKDVAKAATDVAKAEQKRKQPDESSGKPDQAGDADTKKAGTKEKPGQPEKAPKHQPKESNDMGNHSAAKGGRFFDSDMGLHKLGQVLKALPGVGDDYLDGLAALGSHIENDQPASQALKDKAAAVAVKARELKELVADLGPTFDTHQEADKERHENPRGGSIAVESRADVSRAAREI